MSSNSSIQSNLEMEIISTDDTQVAKLNKEPNGGKIEMKQYLLDDLKALKKKWSMINHKPEIDVNGEASNGSSLNIDMKTSVFELMKAGLINSFKKKSDIQKVEFPTTSKAQSKNGEEADVEYHVEVTFVNNGATEKVKLKCYTTNCRIQVQNFGKHERKEHLGNQFVPKYFVNRFIVPYLESVLSMSADYDKVFVPHLRAEIQRLQKKKIQDKARKGSAIDTDVKNAKCENTGCQWINVILKNVEAYGHCVSCNGYEHHHCAGTSKMLKDELKLGQASFVCTKCMERNPALGKEITVPRKVTQTTERSLDLSDNIEVPEIIQVKAVIHSPPDTPIISESSSNSNSGGSGQKDETPGPNNMEEVEKFKCSKCGYKCKSENELVMHEADQHAVLSSTEFNCETCDMEFTDENTLKEHTNIHSGTEYNCDLCNYKSNDSELLATHKNFSHVTQQFECNVCSNLFDSAGDLEEHSQLHEEMSITFLCDLCAFEALSDGALDKHKTDEHTDNPVETSIVQEVETIDETSKTSESNEEDTQLKRKLRLMEDSYDRLMSMYQKQQSEFKDKALAYKIELEEVNECLRVVKTENEKLKEVNEIQHKLWKIFVDKIEMKETETEEINKKSQEDKSKENPPTKIDDTEILDDEDPEDIDTEASYQEWLRDTRKRGFRRSNPSATAEKNSNSKDQSKKTFAGATKGNNPATSPLPEGRSQNFVRYCHNWNNLGKCTYADCRFVHETAPVCSFDGNCSRPKCMFTHKKQNMDFLSKKYKPPVNPWQGMGAPWPNPFPYQPNPWLNPAMNRRN